MADPIPFPGTGYGAFPPQGVLQHTPPAMLEAQLIQQEQARAAANAPAIQAPPELAGYIRTQFEIFRNHRNTASGWSGRLLEALRAFNGQYSPAKMQEVKKFGGSDIYARLTAQKCRAASSLLRDVYLGADRPWAIKPPADPDVPDEIIQKIAELLQHEHQMVTETTGEPPSVENITTRRLALMDSAMEAAKKKATQQAKISEDRIEEVLREGLFYHALAEFLVDLPIFPFACLKGPIVRIIPDIVWRDGKPTVQQTPKMMWARVSPFDLWWTPGVSDIGNANVIEKSRLTRAELNDLLDLPGFDQQAVRAVLTEYGRGGLYDNWDTTDAERATLESRENPAWNRSGLISQMEFHGNVQGEILREYGLPGIDDPLRDYHIDAFCIGSHIIKVNLSPSPRARHNYFITSFEKVPGTPVGNGLTDLVADVQEAANATLRSLINNLSISSGPQVVVNDDRMRPEENADELYPWKRWHVTTDPVGNNAKPPVEFFQPKSNAQELLTVFKALIELSDDVSAIPKYVGGNATGGAGRTASGLAMLMGNASKILQTVAANIDRDVFEVALSQLADLLLLTDTTGVLTGEEDIYVQGVNVAVQRETQRQRQLEFLQHTQNPVDMEIMGIKGRGAVLRSVSQTIGLEGDNVVPSDAELAKKEEQQKQQAQSKAITEQVDKGIQAGVEQGVQKITSELTAGFLASHAQMPDAGEEPPSQPGGPPGMGAPPPPPGGGATGHAPPGPGLGGPPSPPRPGGTLPQMARQAQGAQTAPLSNQRAMPANVVGNQPRLPPPGGRPRPIGGGPG
jgi:hypothetical protein